MDVKRAEERDHRLEDLVLQFVVAQLPLGSPTSKEFASVQHETFRGHIPSSVSLLHCAALWSVAVTWCDCHWHDEVRICLFQLWEQIRSKHRLR